MQRLAWWLYEGCHSSRGRRSECFQNCARSWVPKTTVYDHISRKVMHGNNPGPKPYLLNEEEKNLVCTSKQCSKIGCGKTRWDVVAIVHNTVSDKGVLQTSQVFSGLWCNFLKRNQDLFLRQGHVWMEAMNSETMKHYFGLMKETLEVHVLVDWPAQIYIVDESGMPLNPWPPKMASPKGRQKSSTNKATFPFMQSVDKAPSPSTQSADEAPSHSTPSADKAPSFVAWRLCRWLWLMKEEMSDYVLFVWIWLISNSLV